MVYKLDDYVEVPERIAAWYKNHPTGRIVCEVVENGEARVTVKASVYRTDDPLEPPAGVGHSALGIPGKTPYTKDSELENAETSAAGRALVMAGIPSKHVASAGEVRSKSAGAANPSAPQPASPAQKQTTPRQGASGGASRSGGSGATASGKSREDAPASKTPTPARAENPWEGMEGFS